MQITVTLNRNRNIPGTLRAVSSAGEVLQMACLGKADRTIAAAHGNPTCDPLKPFGDTTVGTYSGFLTVPGANLRSYGPFRRIALHAVAGDAWKAKRNGRAGEMAHGGDLAAGGELRPTEGCVRVANPDMEQLAAACDRDAAAEGITVIVVEV